MKWAIKHKSGLVLFVTSDEFIADNRRKMGWIVEEVKMSKCPKCNSTGMADSGGVQSWGEPILIECDCVAEEVKMTSREQFEKYAADRLGLPIEMIFGARNGDRYLHAFDSMNIMQPLNGWWTIWQASRAAIEIDLPEPMNPSSVFFGEFERGEAKGISECVNKIEQAGLKVKK